MDDFLTLLVRAHKLLQAASDEAMSRHGVRIGQNLILEALWETDGLTPGEVASRARLPITTPTIVNTATRMEAAGLLTRRRDPNDGRLVRLYLTDRARAARQPIKEARRRLEEHATATLTDEERDHLRTALTKILQQLGAGQADSGGEHG
ncbi:MULTISPECIES: MarR family winged helix-turn-helix transcriptional regulator [Actinoallomurus]|uniref:MarR family winged helix-turn-helix transcriptional regulator n=1 Tax=Actinoallomurus TaxID=667113 RepID=UPI0020929C75|nr:MULTISPECIES: MarR family transcriptional regulator [Actinoallomurus]MCO5973846.1 MarR family transcriptional regulator [Actinoallomurus soli]MCO5997688.1 MarR family transcriptional regulator [Actinoallomurus rhizosphaericola]